MHNPQITEAAKRTKYLIAIHDLAPNAKPLWQLHLPSATASEEDEYLPFDTAEEMMEQVCASVDYLGKPIMTIPKRINDPEGKSPFSLESQLTMLRKTTKKKAAGFGK